VVLSNDKKMSAYVLLLLLSTWLSSNLLLLLFLFSICSGWLRRRSLWTRRWFSHYWGRFLVSLYKRFTNSSLAIDILHNFCKRSLTHWNGSGLCAWFNLVQFDLRQRRHLLRFGCFDLSLNSLCCELFEANVRLDDSQVSFWDVLLQNSIVLLFESKCILELSKLTVSKSYSMITAKM
jgi:hypothetical protein